MRFACAMMVGAGESVRYLDRMLRYAAEWANVICVYADGADADTLAAIRYCDCEVAVRVEPDSIYEAEGEGAARNRMFELLDATLDDGDLVVNLDADEQLIDGPDLMAAQTEQRAVCWRANYLHVWDRAGTVYRTDGLWFPDVREAAWRHRQGGRTEAAGAMFAESTPTQARERRHGDVVLTIHHWGYAHLEDRVAKHALYMSRDGGRQHNVEHLRSIVAEPKVSAVGNSGGR